MIRNLIISTIIQLTLFTIIPFVYYLLKYRKASGFFEWVGLKKSPPLEVKYWALIAALFVIITVYTFWLFVKFDFKVEGMHYDSYAISGLSLTTIIILLIWAFFQTSLSEEIFFRGFLMKAFGGKDWRVGNIIQAVVFGIIHAIGFLEKGVFLPISLFLITGFVAYVLGWIVEKKSEGSIVNTWLIHAVVNVLSAIVMMTLFK